MYTLIELIEHHESELALEGSSGDSNPLAQYSSISFGQKLKESITDTFKNITGHDDTTLLDARIKEWLEDNSYMAIKDITVYRPVGLNIPMLDYIGKLNKPEAVMSRIIVDLIEPLSKHLGEIVNDIDLLDSPSSGKIRGINKDFGKDPKDYFKDIGKSFKTSDKSDEAPFGKLYGNISSFEKAFTETDSIKQRMSIVPVKEVEAAANTLFDRVMLISDTVREARESDIDAFPNARPVLARLADSIKLAASWISAYSVYSRQLIVLENALFDSSTKLKKLRAGKKA